MIGLSSRVHTYTHPTTKDELIACFTQVLETSVQPVPGTSIFVFTFTDGSSYSVEFVDDALAEQQARRGVWLEIITDDVTTLQQKVQAAGLPQVSYLTGRFYFQTPGGQV